MTCLRRLLRLGGTCSSCNLAVLRLTACGIILAAVPLLAQTPLNDRVLVVYNAASRESKQVAEYYMAKRAIPPSHLCKISAASPEELKQEDFDSEVKRPIRKCLERLGKDSILYIVFSYGTPFLVEIGSQTNALDQFVADIWDEFLPERTATNAEVQPYFGAAQAEGNFYPPFVALADYRRQPNAKTIYSVWRLDAPKPALAKGLVDKALLAEANGLTGIGCFDRNRGNLANLADYGYGAGEWEIHRAADFTRRAGFTVIEDDHDEEFGTAPAPLRCDHAAFYAGWYSLDHYNDAFSWNPGAIGIHLDSASAHTPRGGTNWAANAVARGITITAGAVGEPYLENLPRPDQAFFYIFSGANVGDAFLRSERLLKWKIINIGDPLFRPFANSPELAARVQPALVFALGPRLTLGDTTSDAVLAAKRPAGKELNFSISSDNHDLLTVPPTINIPAGRDFTKFQITTHHVTTDGATVRLRAKANEWEVSNTLVVFSLFGALTISPSQLKGGAESAGAILLRHPAATDVTIALKSSNPVLLRTPAQITVPQGQRSVSFPIATQPVSAGTSADISATYEGLVRRATLKLLP